MKSYQYILFDWDGSLIKTLKIWHTAVNTACVEFGMKITKEQMEGLVNKFSMATELGLPKEQFESYRSRIVSLVDKDLLDAKMYYGAKGMLRKLKKDGKKIGLVSSSYRSVLEGTLKKNKVDQYFDVVITGQDVSALKPSPEGINMALEKMNAKKENSIMIGDADIDIIAARNAGIDSMLFHPAHNATIWNLERLKTHNPTYIVRNFKELSALLENQLPK